MCLYLGICIWIVLVHLSVYATVNAHIHLQMKHATAHASMSLDTSVIMLTRISVSVSVSVSMSVSVVLCTCSYPCPCTCTCTCIHPHPSLEQQLQQHFASSHKAARLLHKRYYHINATAIWMQLLYECYYDINATTIWMQLLHRCCYYIQTLLVCKCLRPHTSALNSQEAPLYGAINKFLVPLAVPMLLLGADLRRVFRDTGLHLRTSSTYIIVAFT